MYVCIYICSMFNVNIYIYIYIYIYIKNKTFIAQQVIFRFLPNLRRLNKITKIVKTTNLKTN